MITGQSTLHTRHGLWRDAVPQGAASATLKALLERHGVEPLKVGLLINASVLPTSSLVPRGESLAEFPTGDNAHLGLFRFSSTRIQDELGLSNARTVGLSELGCVSLSHAVWLAHAVMEMEDLEYALFVNADVRCIRTFPFEPQVRG